MKTCKGCLRELDETKYPNHKGFKDGLDSRCKQCKTTAAKLYRERHTQSCQKMWHEYNTRSDIQEYHKQWKEGHQEQYKASQKMWVERNKDRINKRTQQYAKEHPEWKAAQCAKRRATKLQAMPLWTTKDDLFLIEEAHNLASLRSQLFSFAWNVDHVVPLQSDTVCGLHVWWNLQVIPKTLNISKGNRYWPDMPQQQ